MNKNNGSSEKEPLGFIEEESNLLVARNGYGEIYWLVLIHVPESDPLYQGWTPVAHLVEADCGGLGQNTAGRGDRGAWTRFAADCPGGSLIFLQARVHLGHGVPFGE